MNSLNVPEESSLIQDVVLEDWTDDKKVNNSVSRAVKNYVIKRNDLASNFKKEKFSLEVGDELAFTPISIDFRNPSIEFSGYNPLYPLWPCKSKPSSILQDEIKAKIKKNLISIFN